MRRQLAAHTVALQIAALAFQVPFGIGQAATIRVGYFYGARDAVGMGRAGWIGHRHRHRLHGHHRQRDAACAPMPLLAIYIDPWDPANAALVGFALHLSS